MRSIGVEITSGRTQFYEKVIGTWVRDFRTASVQQANEIFPDFVSSMFEVMDFIDVYKSLGGVPTPSLKSIAEKLQKGVNGPINSADESCKSTAARNFIFEALVAARAHRPEKSVYSHFGATSDTGLIVDGKSVWIECKRLTSLDKLEANVRKACNQIESALKRDASTQHRGLVAIDFTKIINKGDKILVKSNDSDLLQEIDLITERIIQQCSHEWEKVYKTKNRKILGTLVRFSTMATSESRNLIVRASQWAINPKLNIKSADEQLLYSLAAAMK